MISDLDEHLFWAIFKSPYIYIIPSMIFIDEGEKVNAVAVRVFLFRLDKDRIKCYNKNEIWNAKEDGNMKWVILGVIFGVCAVIRGNGVAFFK